MPSTIPTWSRDTSGGDELLEEDVQAIQAVGVRPVPYMSGWFFHSRNPQELADEVRRLRDHYGFEGVYCNGLPVQDWVVAYEEARLTRGIFPDGAIIFHHTDPAPMGETGTFSTPSRINRTVEELRPYSQCAT